MKTTGTIKSLVQGVSTQHPKERIEGQCWVDTNFIPDPVEGAVKRPGSRLVKVVATDLPTEQSDPDALSFETIAIEDNDYAVGCIDGRLIVRDMVTGNALEVKQSPDTYQYFLGGIKASTNIGEYTLLSGTSITKVSQLRNTSIHPLAYTNNSYSETAAVNRVVVLEVRQGVYSGTYSVRRSDGTVLASYTVPNGATGSDSVSVQPAFIATQIYNTLVGLLGTAIGSGVLRAVHQTGASIAMFLDFTAIDEPCAMFVDDGAYNTRFVMSDRFTTASTTLPSVGVQGHVMEVGKANRKSGNYYVRFEHTQGGSTSSGTSLDSNKLRPGRWVETSQSYASTGYSDGGSLDEDTLPSLLYIFNGVAYVGSGTYIANQVLADTGNVITPLTWGKRAAGSDVTAPDPNFVGSSIVWMGIFQDRLVIMSEQGVAMSRSSDYLNFYRESVIDDLDTDPVNITSTFDSTDKLVGAALLDKNLIVVGTKTHYAIVGRTGITPKNGALLKTSSFESSPNVSPVAFGNMVYFASASELNSDILAIQPSDTTDSTYAYPVSSHVDGYIPGNLVGMYASTKLNILFMLSADGVLYGYRTLFNQGERVMSSWFDFKFPSAAKLQAVVLDNTKIRLLFTLISGQTLYTVVAELNLDRVGYTGVNRHTYLDFWSDYTSSGTDATFDSDAAQAVFSKEAPLVIDHASGLAVGVVAKQSEAPNYVGTLSGLVAGKTYRTGVPYLVEYVPTLPVPKDREGKVTNIGKLIVAQMKLNYSVGAQIRVSVYDKYRDHEYMHTARVVGAPDSVVGKAYIKDGSFTFPVGSAEPDTRVVISSYDHYPLVLSSIDWTGQYFKRGASM